MSHIQTFVSQCHGLLESLHGLCLLIASNVLVVHHVGTHGDIDGSLVGPNDRQLAVGGTNIRGNVFKRCGSLGIGTLGSVPYYGLHRHQSHETHLALQVLVFPRHAVEVCAATPRSCRGGVGGGVTARQYVAMRRGERSRERNAPRLRSREVYGNHLAAQRGDGLAFILYSVHFISNDAQGAVNIKQPLIVAIVCMPGHGDIQVAERLVRHAHVLARSKGHHLLVGQLLSLLIATLEDELTHFGQVLLRFGIHHLIRLTGPDGLLVQLYAFHGRRTIYHTAHRTITDGQSLCPCLRWTVVP